MKILTWCFSSFRNFNLYYYENERHDGGKETNMICVISMIALDLQIQVDHNLVVQFKNTNKNEKVIVL